MWLLHMGKLQCWCWNNIKCTLNSIPECVTDCFSDDIQYEVNNNVEPWHVVNTSNNVLLWNMADNGWLLFLNCSRGNSILLSLHLLWFDGWVCYIFIQFGFETRVWVCGCKAISRQETELGKCGLHQKSFNHSVKLNHSNRFTDYRW